MATRIDLQNASLSTFEDAARQGGRMRVRKYSDGKQELIYGERSTLFGRAVGWIHDAFKSTARLERESGEEMAATQAFFDYVRAKYGDVAEKAASASVANDRESGAPMTRLIGRSIKVASETQSALRWEQSAENLEKAAGFLPGRPAFTKASAAAGVEAGKLSVEQLKFADALIRFEVAARDDKRPSRADLTEVAKSAAKLVETLGNKLPQSPLWFSGKTSIGQELDRLATEDPRALAVLGLAFRNDSDSGLPLLRAAVLEALGKTARNIGAFFFPAGTFPEKPSGEEPLGAGGVTAEIDTSKDDLSVILEPETSFVKGKDYTSEFAVDWNRMDVRLPVDVTTTIQRLPEEDDQARNAVAAAIANLAEQSPGVGRVWNSQGEEDTNKVLRNFTTGVAALLPNREPVTVALEAKREQVTTFAPDSPLTLEGQRKADGSIEIRARMMTAQLSNSGSLDKAVEELTTFAGGSKVVARQLTRVLQQGIASYVYTTKTLRAFHPETGDASALIVGGEGPLSYHCSVSRMDKGVVVVDVSSTMVLNRAVGPDGTEELALDPTESKIDANWQLRIPGDSLRNGNPRLQSGGPITAALRVKIAPEAILSRLPRRAAAKPLDPNDPLDAQRIGSHNDLLFALYRPGGLKAADIWRAANANPDNFAEAATDLIGVLMADQVKLAIKPLTPEELVEMAGKIIKKVGSFEPGRVVENLTAGAALGGMAEQMLDSIANAETGGREGLVNAMVKIQSAQRRLLDARGIEYGADDVADALAPVYQFVVGEWPLDKVRRFVEQTRRSPDVRAVLAAVLSVNEFALMGCALLFPIDSAMKRLGRGDDVANYIESIESAVTQEAKDAAAAAIARAIEARDKGEPGAQVVVEDDKFSENTAVRRFTNQVDRRNQPIEGSAIRDWSLEGIEEIEDG